ncbi:MAG: hypothetical protein K8S27_03235 [Candidatus Omnitrophica bacterium]|nr:hypothetical protein [Candidatus Omnitrophota bacterium]
MRTYQKIIFVIFLLLLFVFNMIGSILPLYMYKGLQHKLKNKDVKIYLITDENPEDKIYTSHIYKDVEDSTDIAVKVYLRNLYQIEHKVYYPRLTIKLIIAYLFLSILPILFRKLKIS